MKTAIAPIILGSVLSMVVSACASSPSPTATSIAPTPIAPTPISPTTTPLAPTPISLTQIFWPPTPTPIAQGKTIVVNSADDLGPGTLRQALADAEPGDIITFDPAVFPPTSPTTITLQSSLPELRKGSLTIDASNAGVILEGGKSTFAALQFGLHVLSNSNTIRGLQIVGFSLVGIGLEHGASYNIIGGDRGIGAGPLGQGNLISGNGDFGIAMWDEGTSYNTIMGNYIGIRLDGTESWGHKRDGIHAPGATFNLITDNIIGWQPVGGDLPLLRCRGPQYRHS
ncbi:MAG: hypothetical protein IIC78_12915 [Chloroflexi bacterium]|nr:hypothetical protein [Chloroflexota bacterium]